MELSDQHILVTGASKGIGAAIARELLLQGARVALHYHSDKTGAKSLAAEFPEEQTTLLAADFEQLEEVQGAFQRAVKDTRIDTLILNAGVFIPHEPTLETEDWWQVWRKTLAINLDACGLLTKLALDHFRQQGGGRLLYIGSRAAFRGETEEYLAYAASKGGITALSRSVARSYGKAGVTSFVIAPGFTRTPMAEPFINKRGEEAILEELALTRLTHPEDIAPLAAFICSGKMDHATGTTIDLNAGSYMH